MSLPITRTTRAWLGALAFAGAVGGHTLAYALVEPGAHQRAELLRATGHRLWPVVVALALAGLVAGLAGCLRDGAARLRSAGSQASLYPATAGRLVGLQLSCFLLLETAERAITHGHLHSLIGEPAVLVGMVVQVITALLGAALLLLFARVTERRRARTEPAVNRSGMLAPVLRLSPCRHRLLTGGTSPRGPPLSARLSV